MVALLTKGLQKLSEKLETANNRISSLEQTIANMLSQ